MRVLMLSKACIVGIYQRKLEEIAKLGVELLTLVPPSWKDERGETKLERVYTEGYRLEVIPIALNGNFHLHSYPGLGKHIQAFRPDIVHIDEEPYNLAAWQALYHARRAGAKSLFFSWQNIVRQYPPPFSWGERWLLNNVDYGLAGTNSARIVWRSKGYHGRMAVVPQFGVDPDLFHPIESNRDLASQSFTIGYVGRLVAEKGVHVLLEAASHLTGEWRLRIVGSGPERERLGSLAQQLGISERIEWIAWAASTDMPGHYQQMDVLVLPSLTRPNWKEQFGRVLIEAMASGVVIIGSDSGAIPDIVGDAGFIVLENEVKSLAKRLRKVQGDRFLRASFRTKGRERALAHFTHQQVAADTVQVYHEMLEKSAE